MSQELCVNDNPIATNGLSSHAVLCASNSNASIRGNRFGQNLLDILFRSWMNNLGNCRFAHSRYIVDQQQRDILLIPRSAIGIWIGPSTALQIVVALHTTVQ